MFPIKMTICLYISSNYEKLLILTHIGASTLTLMKPSGQETPLGRWQSMVVVMLLCGTTSMYNPKSDCHGLWAVAIEAAS
jgi:hypothetical protein